MTKKRRTKIESKLEESEIRYRRLFETAHDGILILDSETGQITDVNPFLEKLLGFSKSEFLNKKIWEVGAFKNINASKDAFEILQNQGFLRYEDLPLETKSKRLVQVEFVANSYMAGGKLVIQCNIRDITERRKLEQIHETERLLAEEKFKVDSIADATHELRTPLSIIKGNVDLALLKGKNLKSTKSIFRAIDYEIKHLTSILEDLSLITSTSWELKNKIVWSKVKLRPLITTVVKRCRSLSAKKKISLTTRGILDITLSGDKGYLEKMLVNLVKNSILYGNQNGHTEIAAKKSKGFLILIITDNGIGISEEDMPHVFERFYKADKFHKSGSNSIGLGLAIVKWVAEIHGGEVSVKPNKGKGSTFTVSLPLKNAKVKID